MRLLARLCYPVPTIRRGARAEGAEGSPAGALVLVTDLVTKFLGTGGKDATQSKPSKSETARELQC